MTLYWQRGQSIEHSAGPGNVTTVTQSTALALCTTPTRWACAIASVFCRASLMTTCCMMTLVPHVVQQNSSPQDPHSSNERESPSIFTLRSMSRFNRASSYTCDPNNGAQFVIKGKIYEHLSLIVTQRNLRIGLIKLQF